MYAHRALPSVAQNCSRGVLCFHLVEPPLIGGDAARWFGVTDARRTHTPTSAHRNFFARRRLNKWKVLSDFGPLSRAQLHRCQQGTFENRARRPCDRTRTTCLSASRTETYGPTERNDPRDLCPRRSLASAFPTIVFRRRKRGAMTS